MSVVVIWTVVVLRLLILFGVVFYQTYTERKNQLKSAALVQERLEQLNRKRVP